MGYEKGMTMIAASEILGGKPPGPHIPAGPHGDDSAEGGSVNHEALAHTARVGWAMANRLPGADTTLPICLKAATAFYDYQVKTAFMSRKNAIEQMSPSHSQWHLHAATLLLLACRRFLARRGSDVADEVHAAEVHAAEDLATLLSTWLGMHHALCRAFAVKVQGGKWGIVAPGARAWPHAPGTSMQLYYGRNWTRDTVFSQIEGGALPQAAGMARSGWEKNLDLVAVAAVQFLKAEFLDVASSIRNYSVLPPLAWTISIARRGNDFVASLPTAENASNLPVQRWAVFVDGVESYGVDEEPVPINKVPAGAVLGQLVGKEDVRQILGGMFRRKEEA